MFEIASAARGDLDLIVLRDLEARSSAAIAPARGALTTSLYAFDREWLYLDERTLLDPAANVRGGIPVLFPSPGRLDGDTFAHGGKTGAMKQHGFARNLPFVERARGTEGSAWVELELSDSEATRAAFPWPFVLRLRFALRGASLTTTATITNPGTERLPFALGYHPYFAVASAEKAETRIPTRATRAWDNVLKREVALGAIELTAPEVDLHLLDHASNGATLELPGRAVDLGGHFDRWVVWTLANRDFVCLEPWSAPANALNSGEGLIEVAPGAERKLALSITVRA